MRIFVLSLILAFFALVILAGESSPAAEHNAMELHVTQAPLVQNPPPSGLDSKGKTLPAPAIVLIDNTVYGCKAPAMLFLRPLPPKSTDKPDPSQGPRDYVSFYHVADNQVIRPNPEQQFDFVCLEVR